MASDVLFSSGSADLFPGGREKLHNFAGVLNRYPRTLVQISGHTDSRGSEESNLTLSKRRAEAVAHELIAANVSQARISTRGLGESMPPATHDTPPGRAPNPPLPIPPVPH